MLSRYLRYFFLGVLAVLPLVLIINIVLFIRGLLGKLLALLAGYTNDPFVTILIPILSVLLLISIGYSIKTYGKSVIISVADGLIDRIPMLNSINRISKKIIGLVSKDSSDEVKQVVYLEYPRRGCWVPGYVTNELETMAVVFVPTSPNPTSGFTVLVPYTDLVYSALKIDQMTGFVVSVGVEYPEADAELQRILQHQSATPPPSGDGARAG